MRLEEVLVAVLTEKGAPAGGGLLAGPDLVLTCAHVVNAALGLEANQAGRPSGEVTVRLHAQASPVSLAAVDLAEDAWSDPTAGRAPGADLCLLRLRAPFSGVALPKLMDSADLLGQRFRAAGFPEHWDLDVANGVIESYDRMGLFLLRPEGPAAAAFAVNIKTGLLGKEERPAGLIHSGFSGAPVEVNQRIAGIVCEARARLSQVTSYMIPVSAFPKRLQALVDDVFRTYQLALGDARADEDVNRVRLERWVLRQRGGEPVPEEIAREESPPAEPSPVPMFTFGQITELPGSAFSRLADKQYILERQRLAQGSRKTLGQALGETRRIVLLGDPGIGKSTALRELERADLPWIPIRLDLRFYQGEDELEDLLARRMNDVLRRRKTSLTPKAADAGEFLRERLLQDERRDFVFLLDGLDEVPPEHDQRVRGAIKRLLAYSHRCVISCRASDYGSYFEEAVPYVLEDLMPGDIRQYLQKALGEERGDALFESQIDSDRELLSLAANPLLLSLMVRIAVGHPDARIPSKRAELFERFVESLPPLRKKEGAALPIPLDVVNTALEALAFGMVDGASYAVSLADVRPRNIPTDRYSLDAVLSAAYDCRLLLSSGSQGEGVQFIHPLFRDYFAARYLKNQLERLMAGGKEREGDLAALGDQIWKAQWDQSVVMLATLQRRPVEFIVWLAGLTRTRAAVGSLFIGAGYDFLGLMRATMGGASRSGQLVACWKASGAALEAEAKAAVLGALRAVVRYSKSALLGGSLLADAEVRAAIEGLEEIGDSSAIPDLEGIVAADWGAYRRPGGNLARAFPSGHGNFLVRRAEAAIARLRGQLAVWVIGSSRAKVIGQGLPDPLGLGSIEDEGKK